MKIEADRDACISAGNCVMAAESRFRPGRRRHRGGARRRGARAEEDHAREAVKLCPSQALRVAD